MRLWKRAMIGLVACLFVLDGCQVKRTVVSVEQFQKIDKQGLEKQSPFLKAHMKDGGLYVFESWIVDDEKATISGVATFYTPTRQQVVRGSYTIRLDSVALLETNSTSMSGGAVAMTVVTGVSVVAAVGYAVYCSLNPKACFGSCPTFYVSDGDGMRLMAEGFSSSVLPSLEATDIDMLYHAQPSSGELSVEMRNEALETHVIRYVNLIAAERDAEHRVFVDGDRRFWLTRPPIPPVSAKAPEGDCLPLLLEVDGKERYSRADDSYLGAKEEIEFEFPVDHPGQPYGLVIATRQTLLTTYLFYQTLAYMGNHAGHWLAEIERHRPKVNRVAHLIGGIEVLLHNGKKWKTIGVVGEYGPLASDVRLIPLGPLSSPKIRLRLRMTKGAWRMDSIALAELVGPVTPVRLPPSAVLRDGREDPEALSRLLDPDRVLVTLPGDRYTLKYKLPNSDKKYEFLLESRGYYLEWIRKEWAKEENISYLIEMFYFPERALRRLAPEFKRVEAEMENYFWSSKYAKPK